MTITLIEPLQSYGTLIVPLYNCEKNPLKRTAPRVFTASGFRADGHSGAAALGWKKMGGSIVGLGFQAYNMLVKNRGSIFIIRVL